MTARRAALPGVTTASAGWGLSTTGLGLGAHALGGAALPGAPVALAVLLAALGLARLVTARERGLPVLLAAVTAGQLGVHAALVLGGPAGPHAGWCGPHDPAARGGHTGVAVTAAHVLAAAATAWWLRRGEQRAARLARAVTARVAARLGSALTACAAPATPARRPRPSNDGTARPRRQPTRTGPSRRGPPRPASTRLPLPA